jgi:uncharacterized membrane protein
VTLAFLSAAAPTVGAAFLASLVEAVEAFTIVLAVGTIQGWRPAALGALAGLVALATIVAALGPALAYVPLAPLQLAVGVLLLLFGMRWLRKAVLRAAGRIPLRDEVAVYAAKTAQLEEQQQHRRSPSLWIAGATAFKAVLLEGLEVVFIVLAVSPGRGTLWPASLGALAACLLVLAVGTAIRRPLARVPENALKFAVGVLLSAFGVFWTGEGLGIGWPGHDAALFALVGVVLLAALVAVAVMQRIAAKDAQCRCSPIQTRHDVYMP